MDHTTLPLNRLKRNLSVSVICMITSPSGGAFFFNASSWYLFRKPKESHIRIVLLRFKPSLYCRRCSAQTRTLWSSFVAAGKHWESFYIPSRKLTVMLTRVSLSGGRHCTHQFALFERPTVRNSESRGHCWDSGQHEHEWHSWSSWLLHRKDPKI